MRLVLLSDTHMHHAAIPVPPGDVVIHTGDFTTCGTALDFADAAIWFRRLPHARKICIAGNHDLIAEDDPVFVQETLGPEVDYLCSSGVDLDGLKVWGSPIQPEFRNWAFNRGKKFRMEYWRDRMPTDVDILLTHVPPRDILDETFRGERVGDKHLLRHVTARVKPKLHVFGHIHESRGAKAIGTTAFVNASIVNKNLQPVHPCWVFDWTGEGLVLVSK